jgi:UrcA family protein
MNRNASNKIAVIGKIGKFVVIGTTATLIAIAGLAPAIYAAPSGDVPRVVVKYDADQAQTEAGAQELYNRLSTAAKQVCPSDITRGLNRVVLAHQCQQEALARAVAKVHTRHLVEIAAAKANRG